MSNSEEDAATVTPIRLPNPEKKKRKRRRHYAVAKTAAYHQLTFTSEGRPLTIQSHGLGVDSTALTVLLLTDPRFKKYYPDAIVHSDTGAEMPHTHQLVLPALNQWLTQHDYQSLPGYSNEVIVLGYDDPRYRPPSRRGMMDEWHMQRRSPGIPTREIRSCTDGAKIAPTRAWLNQQLDLRFGKWKRYGLRHRVLIGIAADEAARCEGLVAFVPQTAQYLENVFPLVEFGITKAECLRILAEAGLPAYKSGCFLCPFQPLAWWWAIRVLYPELHARSVAMEELAAARNPKLRLVNKLPLDEEIDRWVARQLKKHGCLPDPHSILASTYALNRCWSEAKAS
jgi:hypothetical protein